MIHAAAANESARGAITTLPSSSKDDGRSAVPPANRGATALCEILGNSALDGTFADALLLAHHPLVCHSAKGAVPLWRGIATRAFGGVEGVDRLLHDEGLAKNVANSLISTMQHHVLSDR